MEISVWFWKISLCFGLITIVLLLICLFSELWTCRKRKKEFSNLLKIAPASYSILNVYAKSLKLSIKMQSPKESLKRPKKWKIIWYVRGKKIIYVPRFLLDSCLNVPETWDSNLTSFAHEIGHTKNRDKNCPLASVKNLDLSLCPADEIDAQRKGITILTEDLRLMTKEKISRLERNHFSNYLTDILEENKKCANVIRQGKCPRLTWEEVIKVIDYGV